MKNKKDNIGKIARVECRGFSVYVEILDYRTAYGKDRWLVEPLAGEKKAWVQDLRILPPAKQEDVPSLFN